MADVDCIPKLIQIASTDGTLETAQHQAAKDLLTAESPTRAEELYNGCAATQSCLFQLAGINIPTQLSALGFVGMLHRRGWKEIAPGSEQPGDVGTTCYGGVRHPGVDHVYLVLKRMGDDENIVADNQARVPHFRSVSGRPDGKSPTRSFWRAQ